MAGKSAVESLAAVAPTVAATAIAGLAAAGDDAAAALAAISQMMLLATGGAEFDLGAVYGESRTRVACVKAAAAAGVPAALVAAAARPNRRVACFAIDALQALSNAEGAREPLVAAGVVPALIAAVADAETRLAGSAALALTFLAHAGAAYNLAAGRRCVAALIVAGGGVPALVKTLRRPEPYYKNCFAGALTSLTGQLNGAGADACVAAGAAAAVGEAALIHKTPELRDSASRLLFNLAALLPGEDPDAGMAARRRAIFDAVVLPPLLALCRAKEARTAMTARIALSHAAMRLVSPEPSDPALRSPAVADDELRIDAAARAPGAAAELVNATADKDASVAAVACQALSHLVLNCNSYPENAPRAAALVGAGTLPALLAALRREPKVAMLAAQALGNIALGHSAAACRDTIVANGGAAVVLQAAKHSSEDVAGPAIMCLKNLLMPSPDDPNAPARRNLFVALGAVKFLAAVMVDRRRPVFTAELAAIAIVNIAWHGDDDKVARREVVLRDALPALLKGAAHSSDTIAENALCCIANCSAGSGGQPGPWSTALHSPSVLPQLVAAMARRDRGPATFATSIIANLCNRVDMDPAVVALAAGPLVAAMRREREVVAEAVRACYGVSISSRPGRALLVAAGIVPALMAVVGGRQPAKTITSAQMALEALRAPDDPDAILDAVQAVRASRPEMAPRKLCARCAFSPPEAAKLLKACSRCKAVWYCSVACQREAWPEHKLSCVPAAPAATPAAAAAAAAAPDP